jgi:hypothetical protein
VPASGRPDEHVAELRDIVTRYGTCLDRMQEVAVVRSLLSATHKQKIIELCSG